MASAASQRPIFECKAPHLVRKPLFSAKFHFALNCPAVFENMPCFADAFYVHISQTRPQTTSAVHPFEWGKLPAQINPGPTSGNRLQILVTLGCNGSLIRSGVLCDEPVFELGCSTHWRRFSALAR